MQTAALRRPRAFAQRIAYHVVSGAIRVPPPGALPSILSPKPTREVAKAISRGQRPRDAGGDALQRPVVAMSTHRESNPGAVDYESARKPLRCAGPGYLHKG